MRVLRTAPATTTRRPPPAPPTPAAPLPHIAPPTAAAAPLPHTAAATATPHRERQVARPARSAAARLAGLGAAVAALLLACAAAPAQASGYRYWSYWLRSQNAWTYARTGPATHTPKDGDVEGWRFAVSPDAAAQAARPRGAAGFAAICAATPPAPGTKRIALLIDPGTAADAPGGQVPPAPRTVCARVPSAASSADALAAVARPLRYDSSGILCAIGGYPRTGCGEQVAGSGGGNGTDTGPDPAGGRTARATAPAAAGAGGGSSHGAGPTLGVFAGIAAVLALGAAAGWRARHRRP